MVYITSWGNNYDGSSPLNDLVSQGQIDDVEKKIKNGCDVNEKNYIGDCAVTITTEDNDLLMLKVLVKAGAKVDVKDPLGRLACERARDLGYHEVAKFLEDTTIAQKKMTDKIPPASHFSSANISSDSTNFFKDKAAKVEEEYKQQTPSDQSPKSLNRNKTK